jgi:hypothetical protein
MNELPAFDGYHELTTVDTAANRAATHDRRNGSTAAVERVPFPSRWQIFLPFNSPLNDGHDGR